MARKLVRQSRWMRVYDLGDSMLYESKFLTDALQVSAASVISEWESMTEEDRAEFALAFMAKPNLESNDEEILNHLMEVGSPRVLRSIALLTVRHPDRERAVRFLVQQLERRQKPLANFYQALELLKDQRAVPALRREYERYKASLATGDCEESDVFEYLGCCKALSAIEGNSEYADAIYKMRTHPSEAIRQMAKDLMQGQN